MTVCSFLGHNEVYDKQMAQRAQEAVLALAEQEEGVQFLFPAHQQSPFHLACWEGIQKAKNKFPEKKFLVHLIAKEGEKDAVEAQIAKRNLPIDRVVAPVPDDPPGTKPNVPLLIRKRARWIIGQSDYIICYIYEEFYDLKAQLYQYAQKNNVQLIQLAEEKTRRRIADEVKKLPQQERLILEQRRLGKTYKEISQLTGLNYHMTRQIAHSADWKIQQEISKNPA